MVIVFKDIFYTQIPSIDHGQCHLDLYLPEKCYDTDDCHQDVTGICRAKSLTSYDAIKKWRRYKRRQEKNERGLEKSGVPFVLFIHGGGWRRGGKEAWTHYLYFDVNFLVAFLQYFVGTYGNIGETLARNKVACAVVSYPLTEAGVLTVSLEMILSYLQSLLCVILVVVLLTGLRFFFKVFWNSGHDTFFELLCTELLSASIVVSLTLTAMVFTNLLTSGLVLVRRIQFGLTLRQYGVYVVALTVAVIISFLSPCPLWTLVIATTTLNQGLILYLRLQRHGASYEQQVEAVAQAVRWAKSFSENTGYTNPRSLYLMGHSAGGHLATLSALDQSVLTSVSCSTADIKGIISISGVYDLLCLNKHLLRTVYLLPTFGADPENWLNASPQHLAQQTTHGKLMPKFLLILAEKDLFLRDQSFEFARTLENRNFNCQHVEIGRTNHFSIITNTSTSQGSTLSYVLKFVS